MCTLKDIENVFKPRIHSEDGRYWAEIPAMPGCLTVADTLDELRDNLIEAAQCWLLTSADIKNHCRKERYWRYADKQECQSRRDKTIQY
jgi:predicted RNase H-like HicB family nuclease